MFILTILRRNAQMSIEKLVHNFTNAEKLPFTILSNLVIQNLRDGEVLAIWVYLSSMPSDWTVNRKQLMTHFNIGENKIEKIMATLRKLNLLEYVQDKKGDGTFSTTTARILCGNKFNVDAPSTAPMISARSVTAAAETAVHTNKDTNKRNIKTNICEVAAQTSPLSVKQEKTQTIFGHWCSVMDHPKANFDEKRKAVIQKALKLGYSPEQLCQAIDGCKKTPFNMGKNEAHQTYDGLHIILKDADHIERFIENAKCGKNTGIALEKKREQKKLEEQRMRDAQDALERKRAALDQEKWSDEYRMAVKARDLRLAQRLVSEGKMYKVEFREPQKALNSVNESSTKWLPYKD